MNPDPFFHAHHARPPASFNTGNIEQLNHPLRIDSPLNSTTHMPTTMFANNIAHLERSTMPGRVEPEIQSPHITWIPPRAHGAVRMGHTPLMATEASPAGFLTPQAP